MEQHLSNREMFRTPIPDIFEAARLLDGAVSAHLLGRRDLAEGLIRLADMPVLRDYTESLWGAKSPYVQLRCIENPLQSIPVDERAKSRMPTLREQAILFERDGYHCRLCGIPVISKEVRSRIIKAYPEALRWGTRNKNAEQHTAFQLMWATFDHVVPHSRGGTNDLDNVIVICQPCNCAKVDYTLEELGLQDPRSRPPIKSTWDGLTRFVESNDEA